MFRGDQTSVIELVGQIILELGRVMYHSWNLWRIYQQKCRNHFLPLLGLFQYLVMSWPGDAGRLLMVSIIHPEVNGWQILKFESFCELSALLSREHNFHCQVLWAQFNNCHQSKIRDKHPHIHSQKNIWPWAIKSKANDILHSVAWIDQRGMLSTDHETPPV